MVDYPVEGNTEPAVLISPEISLEPGQEHCLKFSYVMYGDDAGTLSVFIEV